MNPLLLRNPSIGLVALTLCSALAGQAHSQTWRPTGPTHPAAAMQGRVLLLRFFGTKGFANVEGKHLRTDDFGEYWVPWYNLPDSAAVKHMSMLGPHLFVSTWIGIYRSGNGGESWTKLPPIPSDTTV